MTTSWIVAWIITVAVAFLLGVDVERLEAARRRRKRILGGQARRQAARAKRADFRRHMELLASQASDLLHLSITSAPVPPPPKQMVLVAADRGHCIRIRTTASVTILSAGGYAQVHISGNSAEAIRPIFEQLLAGVGPNVSVPPPADKNELIFLEPAKLGGSDAGS